jgi:hypothetical protein
MSHEINNEFAQIIQKLIPLLQRLYKDIEPAIIKVNINVNQQIAEKIARLQGLPNESAPSDDNEVINTMRAINNISTAATTIIAPIISELSRQKYRDYLAQGMSQTFIGDLDRQYITIFELADAANNLLSEQYAQHLAESLGINNMAPDELAKLFGDLRIDQYSSFFATIIIAAIIDRVSAPHRATLFGLVEKIKSETLNEPQVNDVGASARYLPQQLIMLKHGFYPFTNFMPLAEFANRFLEIAELLIELDPNMTDADKIFAHLAQKYNCAILLVSHNARTPIEFSILSLIDYDYVVANDLITSMQSGINKKIIQRYNTIRQLANNPNTQYRGTIKRYGDTADKYYVIETFNDIDYRLIHSIREKDASTVKIAQTSALICAQLFGSPPMRNSAYNNISGATIVDKCIMPNHTALLAEYRGEVKSQPPTQPLKDALIQEFTEGFREHLRHISQHGEQSRLTYESFVEYVTGAERNAAILNKVLARVLPIKDSLEFLTLFLHKMDSVANKFSKEMIRATHSHLVQRKTIQSKHGRELESYLAAIYGAIVKSVVNTLDEEPSSWKIMGFTFKEFIF